MASSLLMRASHVVVDQLGMDPLRDKSFDHIKRIDSFSTYVVSDSDRFNAPLISYNLYDTPDLWWALLVYNDILDPFELKPGLRIRVPDQNAVIAALSKEREKPPTNRIVEL